MNLNLKTYRRTLKIDFENRIYKDELISKTNKGSGFTIISIIEYWEIKKTLRSWKYKKVRTEVKDNGKLC